MSIKKALILSCSVVFTSLALPAHGQSAKISAAGAGAGYTIAAKVENGNAYNSVISEVRSTGAEARSGYGFQLPKQLSVPYANGGFTVPLPGALDAKILKRIRLGFDPWIGVSDTNALYFIFSGLEAYDRSGALVGDLVLYDGSTVAIEVYDDGEGGEYREVGGAEYTASYWYVDRDVTVSGGGDDGYSCNLPLKRGWNIVHESCHLPPCNGGHTIGKENDPTMKWHLRRFVAYNAAFKTRYAKGTLGASGKSRPIEMNFESVNFYGGKFADVRGKSKTSAAEDAFSGNLEVKSQSVGGTCKSDEFEIKGIYDLTEARSKTSGSFTGTFTACEKGGKLSKANFEGNWVKHATGNKTPCSFGL